jgi:hypothetical protein
MVGRNPAASKGVLPVLTADAPGFEAAFGPNPMRSEGTLFFSTTRPGAVLAEVFDASGRRVRTLMNEATVKPGRFALKLDGHGERGGRLQAGMYFYRIQAAEGRLGGRFVIVP